ncbi:MAG: benzoyl-CoA reductase, bzd-type, subunit O [Planctomycetes bacterium RBG_16_59_8]|nr:MAG: benzoyl-CoA reductase, bzd-type, subunit O [Planctomycetes bacterium RBG_16_59_8]
MMKYRTAPLKCWDKAKELRQKYYQDYATAGDRGALRVGGSAWAFSAVPEGFGEVAWLTGEPYGASCAFTKDFSVQCLEAAEKKGYARDLCAYMRNYWGSILIDRYAFGGKFPKPDFFWTSHICCSHAKWYQTASELEGGTPVFSIDVSTGPYNRIAPHAVRYVAGQLQDGIEWMQKVTKRPFDDARLIEAVITEMESMSLWAKICELNQNVPAPLDEKSMYALYVFGVIMKHRPEVLAFYRELYDEVKERVAKGIAACAVEKKRLISDTQPPWGFLDIFRHMEKYGALSIGSLYTFGLAGMWDFPDGRMVPKATPRQLGVEIRTRQQALDVISAWTLCRPEYQHFHNPSLKSDMMLRIIRHWKVDGAILHYNRGCEGLSLGIAQNRMELVAAGVPVSVFEGNMGDEREFDHSRTLERIDSFLEMLDLKKQG